MNTNLPSDLSKIVANKDAYNAAYVVEEYAAYSHLQAPERTILQLLRDKLPTMSMLDIGVGGGRTTVHFSSLVRRYVGADYAEDMVDACRKRFAQAPDSVSFQVADARHMPQFADEEFDFVLFSFNGIDGLSHDDRQLVYKEIRRILKPGGYFCFSAHNLNQSPSLFHFSRWRLSWNFKKTWQYLRKLYLLSRVYNKQTDIRQLPDKPYAIIIDGAHDYQLKHYYIRPLEQIRQLEPYFKDVSVYALSGQGQRIENAQLLKTIDHAWIYYLCVG